MTRPTGVLLRLHAVAPGLGTADLARAVSRTLTGEDSPPGGWSAGRRGRVLRHEGTSAEVTGAWDGPELWLRHRGEPAAAAWATGLLDAIATVAAGADRAAAATALPAATPADPATTPTAVPDTDRDPAPRADAPAYLAWRALMARWQVADRDLAEITAPGLLTAPLPAAPSATSHPPYPYRPEEPVFVFDHIGPPKPPPGWLLREWFAPDAGVYHCSVASGSRLSVRTPDPAAGDRCAELLAAWQALTARYDAAA
ncbi:hypothetical protein OG765_09365 [Streptomyces sp. NBC_00555]|uniref:hypothetical protein n=1 Tax=Streptomyces sp. NBC_00555 TaxID=2903662 RepID=UPI00225458E3|nr:hypothetical protein [Streptomyces sp. NBC_00555]MCX5011196.1 hypothetical protein [Streptomyces sp. NBC_00555]